MLRRIATTQFLLTSPLARIGTASTPRAWIGPQPLSSRRAMSTPSAAAPPPPMQRTASTPKRTASQRKAAAMEVAAMEAAAMDAANASPQPAASESVSPPSVGAVAAVEVTAMQVVEEPETPRKRARRSSTQVTTAATVTVVAVNADGDAAVTPKSPATRRKKAADASAAAAVAPAPRASRSKSLPQPVAMDVDATAADDETGANVGEQEQKEEEAVAPKKKGVARSASSAGVKKKKGAARVSAAASQEDVVAAVSRSQSLGSMGGSQQDEDGEGGAGGGGGGVESNYAAQLLVVEAAKRAARPSGSTTIMTWNVNGLRAALRNGAGRYFDEVDADVIALCEVKTDADTVKREFDNVGEPAALGTTALAAAFAGQKPTGKKYFKYWNCCATKKGYSGTALFSKVQPIAVTNGIGIAEHDNEGRTITAEFESHYLVVSYVPNAGQKLERLAYRTEKWDPALLSYLQELQKRKPVIWTGDINVCHQDKDIHTPKTNHRSAGFTPAERKNFAAMVTTHGFVDVFERMYPEETNRFTYWSHRFNGRATHKGWRLDNFVVSPSFMPLVHDTWIGSELSEGHRGVRRSDHAPIFLCIKNKTDGADAATHATAAAQ